MNENVDVPKKKKKSIGLEYDIKESLAWVTGIGTCEDADLVIPTTTEEGYKVIGIRGFAFENCKSIISVVVPKTVEIIEGCAFSNCINIKSVKLHYGLKEIWGFAFENCTSLTSISIPSSVINIGNTPKKEISPEERMLRAIFGEKSDVGSGNPFKGCKKLRSIKVNSGNLRYCDYINCLIDKQNKIIVSGCKTSILPGDDRAETIGDYAFYDCGDAFKNGLYIFETPKIKVIKAFAFSKCNIEKLFFPNTLIRIECSAFRDCSDIKEIVFPSTLMDIGWNAFEGCTKLYKIEYPCQIECIGLEAFKDCHNLTIVTYNDLSRIVTILPGTYSGCTSLSVVNLPQKLEEICCYAFSDCKNLQKIVFPSNLKVIGKESFASCEHLRDVFIPKSVENIDADAFLDCWPWLEEIHCETNIKPENWNPNWNRKRDYGTYHEVVWSAKE